MPLSQTKSRNSKDDALIDMAFNSKKAAGCLGGVLNGSWFVAPLSPVPGICHFLGSVCTACPLGHGLAGDVQRRPLMVNRAKSRIVFWPLAMLCGGMAFCKAVRPCWRESMGQLAQTRRGLCHLILLSSQPSWASLDGIPDVGDLYAARKRYAPKIVDGYQSLKASGSVADPWLSDTFPKMKKAMEKWGAMQRQDMAPDKISRQLLKDVAKFEKAAQSKDFTATMEAFQAYLDDLPTAGPGGSGKLNLADPLGPP